LCEDFQDRKQTSICVDLSLVWVWPWSCCNKKFATRDVCEWQNSIHVNSDCLHIDIDLSPEINWGLSVEFENCRSKHSPTINR